MTTVDLTTLVGDEFVLHFGGRPNEVDAFTFGNSILAFSEALREANKQINPDYALEISIEAVGTGSFRAKLKTAKKGMGGLFRESAKSIVIGVFTALIYEKLFGPTIQIIVKEDSYVVERGTDRVILPKSVYDAKQGLVHPEEIDRHISRGFDALEEDPSITDLGITPHLNDPVPAAVIPRDSFGHLSVPGLPARSDLRRRTVKETTQLVVVRAVLERSERKWQFIWNGHRISAPIKDQTFFDRLASHQFEFGQGDKLNAELSIHQVLDEASGAYINDFYEVTKVYSRIPGPKQQSLLP